MNHRIAQIDRLCNHLKLNEGRPVILMGDFNARPGTKELNHLCKEYKFCQVLPEWTKYPPPKATGTWGESHTFNELKVDPPDFVQSEKDQKWPYSHLEHGILIDHAFVRGLDGWTCCLKVIKLPNESPRKRVSDHRPIALVVTKSE